VLVALDQRHVGRLRWTFDAALVMWHSLGFAGRAADLETLAGLAGVLRPGGRLAIALFHPVWLQRNERVGAADPRGAASVRRWVQGGRCCHEIEYSNGRVDRIAFDLYQPDEIRDIVRQLGLEPGAPMTWWDTARPAASDCARYQVVCEKRATIGM